MMPTKATTSTTGLRVGRISTRTAARFGRGGRVIGQSVRGDAETLAAAFESRFAGILPNGLYAKATGSHLEVGRVGNQFPSIDFDLGKLLRLRDDETDSLWIACYSVLDQFQDFVVEQTTEPWPGSRTMPRATVHVSQAEISLAFVAPDGTVDLVLAPIPRAA
jgi:hypothetical protein